MFRAVCVAARVMGALGLLHGLFHQLKTNQTKKAQNSSKCCRVLDKVSFSVRSPVPFGIRICGRGVFWGGFFFLALESRWVVRRRHRAVESAGFNRSRCALALSKTLVLRNSALFQTVSSILLQHRLGKYLCALLTCLWF